MVSEQEIAKAVETLLRQSDPNPITSLNGVVQQLEAKLGLDLSHKALFIRDQISLLLHSTPTPQQPQPQQLVLKDHFTPQQFSPHIALHHHPQFPQELSFRQPHSSQAAPPPPPPPPPQYPPPSQLHPHSNVIKAEAFPQISAEVAKESPPVGVKRRGGPGGLNKVCGVSPELQAIVGEPAMSRTEIVKQLWAYIRKNNLQDPRNKRNIICDDALRVVFETHRTDMFKMNKLLAKHILPLEFTKESSKRFKPEAESTTESMESGPSPIVISEALAKFLDTGGREMLQAEALKHVWEYIEVNQLEDPLNSKMILCDEKLRELLGCESISALGIQEMLACNHFFRQS